tara:strand:+ start:5739 stop:6398 length:660 start_codon:yes stop_codon:yes gene_type:complete
MGFSDALGGIVGGLLGKKSARKAANRAFPDFLRYRNELLLGDGGFADQLQGLRNDPLLGRAQDNLFNKAPGLIDDLQRNLTTGALSSTAGGQVAALESARAAAGGRGGLAFGGGAAGIGAAGARASAPQQATALANALGQATGLRLQNIQAQGDFAFNKRAQELALRQQMLSGITGLAGGGQQATSSALQAGIGASSMLGQGIGQFAGSIIDQQTAKKG